MSPEQIGDLLRNILSRRKEVNLDSEAAIESIVVELVDKIKDND